MKQFDVIIIGGGMSGIAAALQLRDSSLQVAIIERNNALLTKLEVTAKWRGNLTNTGVSEGCYVGGSKNFIKKILKQFTFADAQMFWKELGVELVENRDNGRWYPSQQDARVVSQKLQEKIYQSNNIEVFLDCILQDISYENGIYRVSGQGQDFQSPQVIVASGGIAAPMLWTDASWVPVLQKLGLEVVDMQPVLSAVESSDCQPSLAGFSYENVTVTLWETESQKKVCQEVGNIMFTHTGLGGPVIYDLTVRGGSVITEKQTEIELSLISHEYFESQQDAWGSSMVQQVMSSLFPKKMQRFVPSYLWESILKTPFAQLWKEEKKKVKTLCCSWRFSDVLLIGQDRSQTSIGGVLLSELKASSCESKNFPGLHIVGEAMDAAGICGGFNIHWACATGIVAGRSIVSN